VPRCATISRVSDVDVVVVGAGPSGAATALGLARAGHRVLVVERARFPRDKPCGEGLMPAGVAALERLGLLGAVRAAGVAPITGIAYTHPGASSSAFTAFPAPPGKAPAGGLGVRRLVLDAVLADAVRRQPGITLLEDVRADRLLLSPDGQVAGVATRIGPVAARITVAADGLHSTLRRSAGLGLPSRGRQRFGVVGHWRTLTPEPAGVTVTLCGDHEWYETPTRPGERLVAWLGPRRRAGAVAHSYAAAARADLPHLHAAVPTGRVRTAGAFPQAVRRTTRPGLALTGDAAGYEDPATGEGLAMGLLLAEALVTRLSDLLGERCAPAAALSAYEGDHRRLWRDRRRVLAIALWLGSHPGLTRRTVARAARDPRGLRALLAVNCGYRALGDVRVREWWALLGP